MICITLFGVLTPSPPLIKPHLEYPELVARPKERGMMIPDQARAIRKPTLALCPYTAMGCPDNSGFPREAFGIDKKI